MADPTASSPKFHALWPPALVLLLLIIGPVAVSVILFQPLGFDPAPLPDDYPLGPSISVPEHHDCILGDTERVGDGLLPGPEDLAYDPKSGFLYTGCRDGWIRRVRLVGEEAPVVEDWVHVGGRPLGLAFGPDGSLVVAEAHRGLIMVMPDKEINLLTDEAEGLKFRLTDCVDVSKDYIIYFTDASSKYNLDMYELDLMEGRPHGRLMSFDPYTNQTTVLLHDLYFANGVSLSSDQQSLIFCETPMRRCRRYHIQGEKKGAIDKFIENLPGFPDNIHYDGDGHYWIGLSSGRTHFFETLLRFPFLKKLMVVVGKFIELAQFQRDGGVLRVSLEGQPLALYSDPSLYFITSGLKIENHLYYGSLKKAYISRINLGEDVVQPK